MDNNTIKLVIENQQVVEIKPEILNMMDTTNHESGTQKTIFFRYKI